MTPKELAKKAALLTGEYLREYEHLTAPPILHVSANGEMHVFYLHPDLCNAPRALSEAVSQKLDLLQADSVALTMEVWDLNRGGEHALDLLRLLDKGVLNYRDVATNKMYVMAQDAQGDTVKLSSHVIEMDQERRLGPWQQTNDSPFGHGFKFSWKGVL